MTISSPGLSGVLKAYQGRKVVPGENRRSKPAQAGGEDQVILSEKAKQLKHAQEIVAACPVVREEEVARISHELAAGTYRLDPEAVAERLLEATRLLDREV